jgi:lysophospholipase L1-like esterase
MRAILCDVALVASLGVVGCHHANPGAPTSRAQVWAAFGDSITQGAGASAPDASFIGRLSAVFGPIDNRAGGGTRIVEQVAALEATNTSATSVLWLTGYNDMRAGTDLGAFRASLVHGLAVLRARGAPVYLGGCLPMTSEGYAAYGPTWNHGSDAAVAAINAVIVDAARAGGAQVVTFPGYDPQTMTHADLVHPNDAGHQRIALAFAAAMRSQP